MGVSDIPLPQCPDPVVVVDPDGVVVAGNESSYRMGLSGAFAGHFRDPAAATSALDGEAPYADLQLTSGRRVRMIVTGLPNGSRVVAVHDRTVLCAVEQQLAERGPHATVGEVGAALTHEVNNPVAVIAGRVELMRLHGPLPPALEKHLTAIEEQTHRIAAAVRQLHEVRQHPWPLGPSVDFAHLLGEAWHGLGARVGAATLHLEGVDGRTAAAAEPLGQALAAFLLQVAESMHRRGRVKVSRVPSAGLRLLIEDQGAGVPAGVLARLERGQGPTLGSRGAVLGLLAAAAGVRAVGGSLLVSESGAAGNHWVLDLPVDRLGPQVLVVGSPGARRTTRLLSLAEQGARLGVADSGREGLAALASAVAWDRVILLDPLSDLEAEGLRQAVASAWPGREAKVEIES